MAHPSRTTARVPLTRYRGGGGERARDVVSLEEPMEIRVRPHGAEAATPIAVTMRTPGHDFELVAGFLVTEGILGGWEDLLELSYCRSRTGPQLYNIVEARLRPGVSVDFGRLEQVFILPGFDHFQQHGLRPLRIAFSQPEHGLAALFWIWIRLAYFE